MFPSAAERGRVVLWSAASVPPRGSNWSPPGGVLLPIRPSSSSDRSENISVRRSHIAFPSRSSHTHPSWLTTHQVPPPLRRLIELLLVPREPRSHTRLGVHPD